MSKKQTKIPDLMTPIQGETVHEYIEQRIKDAIDLGALKQSVASPRKDEDGGLTASRKADTAEVIPPLRAGEPSAALSKMRNQYCLHFDDLLNAYAEILARSCSHPSGIRAVVESLRDEIIPERMIISSQSVVHAADLRLFFREILGSDAVVKAAGDGKAVEGSPGGSPKAPAAVCVWTTGGEHGGLQPSCTDAWTFSPYVGRPYGCPHCAKPVEIRGRSK